MLTVHSDFVLSHHVTATENELDKRAFKLLSSKLYLQDNGLSITRFELLPDLTIHVIGLVSRIQVPLNEYLLVYREISIWETFLQNELRLTTIPALKGQHEMHVSVNRESVTFTTSVFNPGLVKIFDGEWDKATGLFTLNTSHDTTIPWGDFVQARRFFGHALQTIALIT